MRRRLLAAAMVAFCAVGHASSLQISPVMIELQSSEGASGITLRNPGDHPLYGQVRVFRWDQANNDDTLTATQDLVASPPLIDIPAHGEQLVRLVRRDASRPEAEQNYRLLIDEIPPADNPSESGVMIRLRYSVPVFVEPAGAAGTSMLTWHLQRDDAGWLLRVTNGGRRRAQISVVQLVTADGKAHVVDKGLLGYALAGRTRQWRVSLDANIDPHLPLSVRANINALPVEGHVSIDTPP